MGGKRSTYGLRRLECRDLWRNLKERDHLEDPGVDRMIILKWIFRKIRCGGMGWIDLSLDRGR
jgi:hypothetical protein